MLIPCLNWNEHTMQLILEKSLFCLRRETWKITTSYQIPLFCNWFIWQALNSSEIQKRKSSSVAMISGKQPFSICSCVRSLWRWFYLITTICCVRSCFVLRDMELDSPSPRPSPKKKKKASQCKEVYLLLPGELLSSPLLIMQPLSWLKSPVWPRDSKQET